MQGAEDLLSPSRERHIIHLCIYKNMKRQRYLDDFDGSQRKILTFAILVRSILKICVKCGALNLKGVS